MPLIEQQDLIFISGFSEKLIKEELENYPPVRIVQVQTAPTGIFVLVETV
jgi:hypothetical protein